MGGWILDTENSYNKSNAIKGMILFTQGISGNGIVLFNNACFGTTLNDVLLPKIEK
ncbi:MAG: hypothetical protein WC959_02095 [Kiritimatiellales bacterium]